MKGRPISSLKEDSLSPTILLLTKMLDQMRNWVSEIPPVSENKRFGNPAFRTWLDKLKEVVVSDISAKNQLRIFQNADQLLRPILSPNFEDATIELVPYLLASFGDWQVCESRDFAK